VADENIDISQNGYAPCVSERLLPLTMHLLCISSIIKLVILRQQVQQVVIYIICKFFVTKCREMSSVAELPVADSEHNTTSRHSIWGKLHLDPGTLGI
jgi:hypothetical protein